MTKLSCPLSGESENVGLGDPKIVSLPYGEWYCEKFVRHVSELEKHECVGCKVCIRLSNIGGESVMTMDEGDVGVACFWEWFYVVVK